jgi:hypothetical protein
MGRLAGGGAEPTTFQRDYEYMLRNFGPQIAANYRARQTDRIATDAEGNIVALPDATPAGPELQRGGGPTSTQRGGGATAAPASVVEIGEAAERSGTITEANANVIRQALGPNGQAEFNNWLRTTGVRVQGVAAPVRVRSVQQAEALAPGTRFIDPDGVERIR